MSHRRAKCLAGCLIAGLCALVAGCGSQAGLTRQATGCSGRDVNIVDSRWKREGSVTTWCATCDSQPGRRWRCTTNASRDRVECADAKPEDGCR